MRKLSIVFALLIFGSVASAATRYVSMGGNNTTGDSWNNAWSELDQIKWANVNPGDTILLDQGSYQTILTLSKAGGSAGSRFLIKKATDAGHTGKVTIKSISVTQPFYTVDGVDKTLFDIYAPGQTMVSVNFTNTPTDFFELKNVMLRGTPSTSCYGRLVTVSNGSLSIDRSEIFKSQCQEDMIFFDSELGANLKIENTYIHGWEAPYLAGYTFSYGNGTYTCPQNSADLPSNMDPYCWQHSDMVSGSLCSMGDSVCNHGDLTFRNNLVDDSGTNTANTRFENIVFMNGYSNWKNIDFSNNVIKGTYQVLQINSAQSLKMTNNVFTNTALARSCRVNCPGAWSNNIFSAPTNYEITWDNSPTYSLWSPGTKGFVSGGGTNIQSDPKFVNPGHIVGSDGIPFTIDDGYNIQSGSPAIDKGTNVGTTIDILGRTISGTPDIGAYEYGGSTSVNNPHPADINPQNQFIDLNEATTFGACWKSNCNANATLDNASRAGFLWKASATGQYQYNSANACPLCWEVKP